MKTDEYSASFIVYDYKGDISELTKEVGIEPDVAKNKGESFEAGTVAIASIPYSMWELRSRLPSTIDPEAQIKELVGRLLPHKDKLLKATSGCRLVIAIKVKLASGSPEISLEADTVKLLGELNAGVWLDIYQK